jgi:hypothetical protein
MGTFLTEEPRAARLSALATAGASTARSSMATSGDSEPVCTGVTPGTRLATSYSTSTYFGGRPAYACSALAITLDRQPLALRSTRII